MRARAVAVCRVGQLGQQVLRARGRLVGELPLADDAPALRAGIEDAAGKAARRVQRREAGIVVGQKVYVSGRVEQGHDAARGAQRTGPALSSCHQARARKNWAAIVALLTESDDSSARCY